MINSVAISVVLLFLLFPFTNSLEAKTIFKYVDIGKDNIEIGTYHKNGIKRINSNSFSLNEMDVEKIKGEVLNIDSANETNSSSPRKILYYFHSLYGGVPAYHRNTVKKLHELQEVDLVISIVWHTDGLSYLNSYEQAHNTGSSVSKLFRLLLSNKSSENNVLCHSMGHRIFQGIIDGSENKSISINKLLFAGTDLPVTIFESTFKSLAKSTEQIVLYVHEKDRLLRYSSKAHQIPRLGVAGMTNAQELSALDNLQRIDVSQSKGQSVIRLSNHIYFKRDPLVLKDINLVLNGEDSTERNNITHLEGNKFLMN